jgi:hypothetical protein
MEIHGVSRLTRCGLHLMHTCSPQNFEEGTQSSEEGKTLEGDSSEICCVCVQEHPCFRYHEVRKVLEVAVPICGC